MRVAGSSRPNRSQGLDTDANDEEKAPCPSPPVCTTLPANNSLAPALSLQISQQPCKVTEEKFRREIREKHDPVQTFHSSDGDAKIQREGRIYPRLHIQLRKKADDISKGEHQQGSHNRKREITGNLVLVQGQEKQSAPITRRRLAS